MGDIARPSPVHGPSSVAQRLPWDPPTSPERNGCMVAMLTNPCSLAIFMIHYDAISNDAISNSPIMTASMPAMTANDE